MSNTRNKSPIEEQCPITIDDIVHRRRQGGPGVPVTPPFASQTTYNRRRKCHDDILAIIEKPFLKKFFLNQSIDEIIKTFASRHPRRYFER